MAFYLFSLATTLCLLGILNLGVEAADSYPIVNTDKGSVQGFTEYVLGKQVDKFLGIPFAQPPVGDLRFQPPVERYPWEGTLDATRLPNSCPQLKDEYFGDFYGSTMWNANTKLDEDCLYLSVWSPQNNPSVKNKAVLVFIYGGSFYSGTHTLDIYNANYLTVENDIVFVGIQYRVGSLGFLSMDTTEAPGNAGLWDQRMALEWVSRNIHNFGGDPNRVTLVGESAGAVSIGLHLLCDTCGELFHGAILQSGAPEANWGVLDRHEMWKRSDKLAKDLGCFYEGKSDIMIKCMREKDAMAFPNNDWKAASGNMQFPFAPIVDGIFLRQNPRDLLREGRMKKVPILLGSNSNEATFFLVYFDNQFNRSQQVNGISQKEYRRLLPGLFEFYPTYPKKLNSFGQDAIRSHYTNWLNLDDEVSNMQSIDSAVSDAYFVCPVNSLARAYSMHDLPVYYYWFDQRWSANPWPEWMGVLHGDEFWFTFGQALNDSHSFTEEERFLSKTMMRYWTNFAKTGNPNHAEEDEAPSEEWPRFHYNEQLYINLSTTTLTSGQTRGQGPRTQSCGLWDSYLPNLVADTNNIDRTEEELKGKFHSWKTNYINEWKSQFDSFINVYHRQIPKCSTGLDTKP